MSDLGAQVRFRFALLSRSAFAMMTVYYVRIENSLISMYKQNLDRILYVGNTVEHTDTHIC